MTEALPPRVVVLLEGRSDVAAVRALLAPRDLDRAEVRLVDLGGVTNVRRGLAQLLGEPTPPPVLGMCDAGEAPVFRAAFAEHGGSQGTAFTVCHRDLEDELVRALGADTVLGLLDELGLARRFDGLRRQLAWREQPLHEQLHRFAGVASGRKELLAGAMAAALTPAQVPRPLADLVDGVEETLR